jgi:hypothetical protein
MDFFMADLSILFHPALRAGTSLRLRDQRGDDFVFALVLVLVLAPAREQIEDEDEDEDDSKNENAFTPTKWRMKAFNASA